MFKLLFGKDRTEKIAESLVGSYQEIAKKIAEGVSAGAETAASEEAKMAAKKKRVEIEEATLQIEKDKLRIETEKLELEKGAKLTATLDVAKLAARSTRYAANIRAGATLFAAAGVAYVTYEYFRPLDDELKKAKAELATIQDERDENTKNFIWAHAESKRWRKVLQKAEDDFVYKSSDKTSVEEYAKFREKSEKEQQQETQETLRDFELAKSMRKR